jgi:uncharacterized protein
MMRFLVLCWCLVGVLAVSSASHAQEPFMGSEATPAPAQAAAPAAAPAGLPPGIGGEDGVYRVLVVGDELAGGLGAGMTRLAETEVGIEIVNRFNESSGLARPEVYDWAAAIPKITADKPVDAIVVLVGVNDRQGIRDKNTRYVFKSPGWVKAYTASVDRLLETAKSINAKVYWISLPPMANSAFDDDMKFLNDIHRARVGAAAQNYVDVRPFFQTPDGRYAERGPDETGVEQKLRQRDGIKFMTVGNNRFGQLVLGTIKTMEAKPAAPVVPETPVALAVPPVAPAAAAVKPVIEDVVKVVPIPPSFGQTGLDGKDETFRADVVKAIAPTPVSVAARNPDAAVIAPASPPEPAFAGSQAQRLVVDGVAPVAPAGRFDDFSEQ